MSDIERRAKNMKEKIEGKDKEVRHMYFVLFNFFEFLFTDCYTVLSIFHNKLLYKNEYDFLDMKYKNKTSSV